MPLKDGNTSFEPSDAEIVEKVVSGEVNAFETLLTRYKGLVLNIANKHVPYQDAEETAHNAFVRAYRSLPTFEGRGGFKSWLASIAVKTCYDYWRKAYRSRELPMSALAERHRAWLDATVSEESEEALSESGAREEARELLDWALSRLSPEDRMVVNLVELEGLTGREAAELLGWTTANVKVRAFRARKKLKALLAGLMEDRGGRK